MKMFLTAVALTIAAPAMAQPAAPADAHAKHAASAIQGSHAGHAAPAANNADAHAGHDMKGGCCDKMADSGMSCCEKMQPGKTMPCCEQGAGNPAVDLHAGHKM